MGHIIRSPSRGADQTDNGLLSLVEQEKYNKQTLRQTNPSLVGISNTHKNDSQNNSPIENSPIMNDNNSRMDRHDALADLIASLSNGSDKSNDSPNKKKRKVFTQN
jgi:hypothetical protein